MKAKHEKWYKILLVLLAVVLIGSIGALLVQTNFGKVRIKNISIITDHQQRLNATMYIPKNASADNKCPVVITSSGWEDAGESWSYVATELSRRGIAVVNMEPYSHGNSGMFYQQGDMALYRNMYTDGMGMIALTDYITSGVLDFIDTNRVGVTGLSMGGICTWTTVQHYGLQYNAAIEAAQAMDSDGGTEITNAEMDYANSLLKVTAALPCGSPPNANNGFNGDALHVNTGCLMGSYEECGDLVSKGNSCITGDAIEGIDFINSGKYDNKINFVEEGKFYGDKSENNLRIIYQPASLHGSIPIVPSAVKDIIEFFTYCFDTNTSIANNSLIYPIKLAFNAIAMLALLALILPLMDLFLAMPVFHTLRANNEPPCVPALTDQREKRKFWVGVIAGGGISFVTAFITMPLYMKLFPDASSGTPTAWFSIAPMNLMTTWTFLNTIWVAFWFWFNFRKDKNAGIRTDEMIGWRISKKELIKTFGVGIAVFASIYGIVAFCKWGFNTDFRIWMSAIKTFNPDKLFAMLNYWPIYFLFYTQYSLLINGAFRVEGMSERKNLFICGLSNSIGCIILLLVQYGVLLATHQTPRQFVSFWNWSDCLVLAINFWLLFLAPYFIRKSFKKTGNIWLGALVVSLIFASMGIMKASMTTTLFF